MFLTSSDGDGLLLKDYIRISDRQLCKLIDFLLVICVNLLVQAPLVNLHMFRLQACHRPLALLGLPRFHWIREPFKLDLSLRAVARAHTAKASKGL